MSTLVRSLFALCLFAALLAGSVVLAQKGIYGWTIFIAIPACAGALASWSVRPGNDAQAIRVGALTGTVGCFANLIFGLEGIMCIVMALPPVVLLSSLGSWLVFRVLHAKSTHAASLALLLPLSFWFDVHASPPIYAVRTSIVVDAPPERVWHFAIAFPDIAPAEDWTFEGGFASPLRTRMEGSGVGAARYCDLSTGPVVERVDVWDKPHRLHFQVLTTPPSMQETGLYGSVHPKHLTGYFVSRAGQFTLSPLPNGRTRLEGTSWYRHGLWPAEYWRWWTDAVVHRIHVRVLQHIRTLSEHGARPS